MLAQSIDSNSHDNPNQEKPNNVDIASKDDTTGSVNLEISDDDNYNDGDGDIDDDGALTDDAMSYVSNAVSTDDAMSYVSNAVSTDDTASNVSREGYEGSNTGSIDNINLSDNASQGEARTLDNDDIDNNHGYQTMGSVSEEAIELQVMGQAHHPPHTDTDQEDSLARDDSDAL